MTNDTGMNVDEASKYLGIEPRTLENWRSSGKGPKFYKPTGKLVFYFKSDLDEWIKGEKK